MLKVGRKANFKTQSRRFLGGIGRSGLILVDSARIELAISVVESDAVTITAMSPRSPVKTKAPRR